MHRVLCLLLPLRLPCFSVLSLGVWDQHVEATSIFSSAASPLYYVHRYNNFKMAKVH